MKLRVHNVIAVAALACAGWLAPVSSHAQAMMPNSAVEQGVLRPGTRPWWFSLAVGPTFPVVANALTFGSETRMNLAFSFGYHLSGRSSGPAFGGEVHQFFLFNPGGYMIEVLGRFNWDFQLGNTGVYLGAGLGVGLAVLNGETVGTLAGPDFQMGIEAKMVIGDRGMLFIRPLDFDIPVLFTQSVAGPQVLLNYDFLLGGGLTF